MSPDEIELSAQAEAGQKLAMVALEMLGNLAKHLKLGMDFAGAASAMINSEAVDNLNHDQFAIEKRAREIVAGQLELLAKGFGQ